LKEEELEKVSAAGVSLTYGAIQWTYTKQDDKADARSSERKS
jgi:type VI protein secretion system component Hcp